MTNPRVVGQMDAFSTTPELRFTWDIGTLRGADLPDSYFEQVFISRYSKDENGIPFAQDATFTPDPKEIRVRFYELTPYLATADTIEIQLVFPDRRDFINCRHPASDDTYFLDINLQFDATGFTGADFNEHVAFGAF